MRITRFRASGYRSLRDFEIDGLGAVNVFYGPNGSGKSNILAALRTMFAALRVAGGPHAGLVTGESAPRWITDDDYSLGAGAGSIAFDGEFAHGAPEVRTAIRVVIRRAPHGVEVSVDSDFEQRMAAVGTVVTPSTRERFVESGYAVIDALRTSGDAADQLFAIKNHPDRAVRASLDRLRALLSGPPLHRPPFDVVQFPDTGRKQLREQVERDGAIHDIPVDLAGLGVAQLYSILSQIKLSKARAVAIEEPEAHLHGPTSGRHLRELLLRLVSEGDIDQLFVATHSNLFDLDPTGYWDVSIDEATKSTRVARKPLYEIDGRHLYEPGPAKHALQETLRLYGDEHVFVADGDRKVSAKEMLDALQRDDELAVEFLKDLHAAALQITSLRARRSKKSEP